MNGVATELRLALRSNLFRVVQIAGAVLLGLLFSAAPALGQVCATPGKDGPGGTLSGVINTYYPGTASASAGATSISVGTPTGAATPIASGDLLLVIQMQDAAINSTNADSYGDGSAGAPASGATSLNNSGRYEYVVATGAAGGTVPVRGAGGGGLLYTYTNANASGTQGQRRFQVVRIPQYSIATLGSGLTAAAWNGTTGGILAFDVAANLTLGSAAVSVSGLGFRGGGTRQLAGGAGGANTDYRNVATSAFHGGKGEGIAGTPRYVLDGGIVLDTGVEGYPNGSTARGAPGNAGGGGTDGDTPANDENSGGGGGSNAGAGGRGGNTWNSNLQRGGDGGASVPGAANLIVLGGGGGGGSRNNSTGTASSGGAGGGIVMIRAGTFSGTGTISADGADGNDALQDGGGGGGAGGSVIIVANSGGLGLNINTRGGRGGDAWPLQAPGGTPGERHGPGGGGGGGFIAVSSGVGSNVSGGANGITTTVSDVYGSTAGASGAVISIVPGDIPGASLGAQCFPTITTTKTTSTAAVINTPTGVTATYTIVTANAANRGTAINLAISDTLPASFTFSSTTTVTLAGGATRPTTTNPTAGATVPTWGSFTVPGGGSVSITFVAQIASTVAAGTYQNPATATYSDPARTTGGGTVSSSYNSASSTAEDVAVTVRDMTITKSHTGNFTQGQTGATYTLTATNSGSAATSGTVTVVDTLPAGLTATAISGTGWTCVLATRTCTRTDALAPGASYPVITVTVNVASNAPASVTNTATVSGGGQINLTNDTATDPTTIDPLPDLTIIKSHTGSFTQGQVGATYSITATNSGSAPTTGTVTVTEALPAGLTATAMSGTGWTCVLGTLTCTRSDVLAAGASYPVITLTVNVANNAAASVTNSVTVSGGGQSYTANDTDTDPTTITQLPDLTVNKSHVGNFTQGQIGATYSIIVTNSGFDDTTGALVSVTDTLPAGLTATAISGTGWTCVLGTLTCTRNSIRAPGATFQTITVTVNVAANAPPSVTNSVTVSGGGQTNTTNDTDTDPTTINQLVDMTIAKSHTGNFTQGQVGATYTIIATNSGSTASAGTVTVTDTLPSGLTATAIAGTGWTCVLGTLTCTRATALAGGASYPAITVTVTVAANAPPSVTNTATVSGGGQTNTTNDTATDPTTINQLPDLTISKSHTGNFTQGQIGATYSLTATNSGLTATSGTVTVTDTLPAGLTATAISGTGWTCVLGTLTCTRSDVLAAGASYPVITVTVNVANNAAASVTNSVAISGGGQIYTANDTDTDPTTINQLPDLTINKSHTGNFTQGQTGATYSLVATNSGSTATSGTVTVTDTLPAGLTATAISGTGWTCVLGTLTCTRSDALAAAASYPAITVTVTVANNAAASVTNSASVSGGGQVNTTNDTDTDPTTVIQLPDLTINKSHTGNFTQGQAGATYTITTTNSGFAATSGTVTITDTLPAGLTATAISGTGWTCVLGTLTCTRSDALAAGASYPAITVTVNVANNAAASVTNSATVSGGGQTNTANDTDTDPTTVNQLPDLTIAKSHVGNFTQGQAGATYTITATNSGFAATSGTVTVTDTLPAGLTATAIAGTGWSCVLGTLTCTRSDALAAGASYPAITVTVNVANNAAASVTNSAAVSGGGQTNTANDSANDVTTINQLPDLTIAKSHVGNFTQGQVGATYTITATNSGFAATSGTVTVTDTLPAGLTATAIAGTGWSCVLGTLTCTRSDALAAGASYPAITLTVNVANNAAASVTNSATVSGGGQTNTTNDTATNPTTINQLPDLSITKSHVGNFTQGQVGATYTITATNSGSAATSGTVTVTDTLPGGLTATAISGTGWSCVLGTLTCTRSDALAAGSSYPAITLTVNVANNAPASVTNSVAVSGGGQTNTTNDTATNPTTINQLPDLSITKSHVGNFTQGQVGATYTITATNSGSAATSGTVTVTDTLPAGLTATAISGTGWSCVLGTLTCTRSDALAAGASYPAITVTVNVANNAAASVTNTASVSGGGQTNTANDTANDVTTINQLPDLTIAKTHTGNFTQGQTGATYSLTATNSGSAATSGTVTVTDTLPAGLTATAISGTGWSCVLGTLTCTRSNALAAGASYPVITVTVNVANNAAASVTNTVTVSGGGQTNTANDTGTDPTTIIQLPDLSITKSHVGNFTQGQTGATYTITATNSGFAATSGTVTVVDTIPSGLTATAISGTGWSCVLGTLTCTRSNALAAGASYPVITLTVDVALSAPGSVTNTATVSGGGENNAANNTANDLTTINAAAPPSISLVKSVSPGGTQSPGTDLLYTVVYTNTGGQPAITVIVVDPNVLNADPLERVFHNVDFMVGSLASSPGTTGLVATFEYSNDGGATWTYTPVSGGGGAPAGYDRNVTNVRWRFAGTLSHLAPNNSGSVSFTVRIR